MRYLHYCASCDARSPERTTDYDAKADRDRHRRRAHHGLAPADTIEEIPGPLAIAASATAALLGKAARSSARGIAESEAVRQVRGSEYWRQAVRLLWIGAAVLILAAVLIHRVL